MDQSNQAQEFISWAPEVFVEGKWSRNSLRFGTKEEAEKSARGLMMRWFLVEDSRAMPATEPVNYRFVDNRLEALTLDDQSS